MKWEGKYPKRIFQIRSKSNPNEWHYVDLWGDGELICDCEAGKYRKPCRHKQRVERYLEGERNNCLF